MLKIFSFRGQNLKNLVSVVKRSAFTSVNVSPRMGVEYKIGEKLHGYELKRIEDIPELFAKAYFLIHEKTKAQHLHIWRDDAENFMAISFRTPPANDTGVAHVLEHLVTMGSANFPVRDIFMKMTSRSLATFMNAMTSADHTTYPFSSTNPKDFENLMKIYMDFVFFPTLREINFRQEAWRVEHENIKDQSSPLQLKGVVLNEMKGVYSSTTSAYFRSLLHSMYPDNTYQYDSGGDPLCIPKLSHQEMKEFYAKYYHPSNSKWFSYGNIPFEKHLELISSWVLSKYEYNPAIPASSVVPSQKPWTSPRTKTIECRPNPMAPFPDKQTTASLTYMLPEITDCYESFVLSIMGSLLTSGQNADFYESLIGSGLGMDFSPGTGYSDYTKQPFFSVGLEGIHENDVEKLKSIIQDTFKKVAEKGFPQDRIEAVLHTIELNLKHQKSLFGLHLAYAIGQCWTHDGDPIEILKINKQIERFRSEMGADPAYLQKRIEKYFINNPHCLFLIAKPSNDYVENMKKKEDELLDDIVKKSDKDLLFKQGIELADYLALKEDQSVLPILDASKDIPAEVKKTDLIHQKLGKAPLQLSPQPTNQVVYFRGLVPLPDNIPDDLKPYWSVFCALMTKLGAGSRNNKEMDQEIKMRTGGLNASSHIREGLDDLHEYDISLHINSKCLERNTDYMFNLWTDIFNKLKYDEEEHISQLIKIMAAEESSSLSRSGHSYVLSRASSTLKEASHFRELTSGLSYAVFLKNLAEKNDVKGLVDKLIELAKTVFTKENMKISLNVEPSVVDQSATKLEHFLNNLSEGNEVKLDGKASSKYPVQPEYKKEHFVFPLNTNFVAKAILCVPYNHPDHPKLRVLAALLSNKYLLDEIREKGGAYGSRANIGLTGIFSYFSYRDPNVLRTVNIFDNSANWVLAPNQFSEVDLNEAKLSVFQTVDKPLTPQQQGTRQFLEGISDEIFQEYRRKLLSVTVEDLLTVAKKYLSDNPDTRVASIGPENAELSGKPDWKIFSSVDSLS